MSKKQADGDITSAVPTLVWTTQLYVGARIWRAELYHNRLLKGDESTDLYSKATGQYAIVKAQADEDLQLEISDFIISDTPQLTVGKMSHLLDCLMQVPLYQSEQVEAEVSATIAEGLPRFRATVNLLVARYGHKAANKVWNSFWAYTFSGAVSFDQAAMQCSWTAEWLLEL